MKTRKMFILPLSTGHYSVYVHMYIIHNNLTDFCCLCFISGSRTTDL